MRLAAPPPRTSTSEVRSSPKWNRTGIEVARHDAQTGAYEASRPVGVVRHGRAYAICLLLMAAGSSSPQVGVIGVVGWLAAMALASLNVALGGLALAWDGRAAGRTATGALTVFAAGVTVSILLLSAIPNQN